MCLETHWKAPFSEHVFIWPDFALCEQLCPSDICLKQSSTTVTVHLPKAALLVGANKADQKHKEKLGNEISIGTLKKLQHDRKAVCLCLCMPSKDQRPYSLTSGWPEVLHRQEWRWWSVEGVSQHTQTDTHRVLRKGWDCWLRHEEICVLLLADH